MSENYMGQQQQLHENNFEYNFDINVLNNKKKNSLKVY